MGFLIEARGVRSRQHNAEAISRAMVKAGLLKIWSCIAGGMMKHPDSEENRKLGCHDESHGTQYVFASPVQLGRLPWSYDQIWRVYQKAAKAGLPKNLVLYCGRHDFGTRVLKKTGNLKLVMQSMGHVGVKTAMKYQHPELDNVRSALNDTNDACPRPARDRVLLRHTLRHTWKIRSTTTGK